MLGHNKYTECLVRHFSKGLLLAGLLLALISRGNPALASMSLDDEHRIRLATFSYAGGELTEAEQWIGDVDSPAAQMLRAKILIGTGRTREAIPLLQALSRGELYRGEAWLLLAQSALAGYDSGNADTALDHATRLGHGQVREQALFYQAEAYRLAGEPEQAGQVLAKMSPGYLAALGYQNVASDYSRTDRSVSRALVALRVALALAVEDTEQDRAQALESELLFQAGYLAYQSEDFPKAESFLKGVSLNSYVTPQALYFHGLALAGRQNYREAMQSWHRAKKWPLALPGVVDAWLGMGRGYDELGYLGQAGEAYLAANAAFESERVTLKSLEAQIKQQGAWQAMVEAAGSTDLEWFLADNRSLTQPRQAYLLKFADDRDGQDAVGRVATLQRLSRQLEAQRRDLGIFQQTITRRLHSMPTAGEIASPQAQAGDRISSVARRLQAMSVSVSSQVGERLNDLAKTLADIKNGYQHLSAQLPQARSQLESLVSTAQSLERRMGRAAERVATVKADAESVLDRQMLAFLQVEDERIQFAQDRAEQHVAYLYEHLALRGLERGDRE